MIDSKVFERVITLQTLEDVLKNILDGKEIILTSEYMSNTEQFVLRNYRDVDGLLDGWKEDERIDIIDDDLINCIKIFIRCAFGFRKFYSGNVIFRKFYSGNVIKNKKTGKKVVVRAESEIISDEDWEKICDKPHEDEDYSYLCNMNYCRCQS